jgi:P2-related tail formation protein
MKTLKSTIKNGIKHDNRLENLEFVTHRENMVHAHQTGLIGKPTGPTGAARAVKQIDPKNGNIIAQYRGIVEASQQTEICATNILITCQGLQNLAGGFKWKYVEEDDNNTEGIKTRIIGKAKKAVRQIDLNTGETIAEYPCAKIAAMETGAHYASIGNVCRGIRKTSGGFRWEYI